MVCIPHSPGTDKLSFVVIYFALYTFNNISAKLKRRCINKLKLIIMHMQCVLICVGILCLIKGDNEII